MELTIKELFDERVKVKFDRKLMKKIYKFQLEFISKNEDHMAFFGGNLTGVHVLRFTDKDFNYFYQDIIKIDPNDVKENLKYVKELNLDWKIVTDVFNLTTMYMVHRFYTSPLLSKRDREKAAADTCMLFNYRTICGIITDRFRYPADHRIASKTYENLSNRFLIKQLGNWQEVLEYRSKDNVSKTSTHLKTIEKFNDLYGVRYLITDNFGRISDMIKNIYREFINVHQQGDRIGSENMTEFGEGGVEEFKDKVTGFQVYNDYIFSILSDRNSFIKPELLNIVSKTIPTASARQTEKVLVYLSENYYEVKNIKLFEDFINKCLEHSFNYLEVNGMLLKSNYDLSNILVKLKGMYMSSRSTEVILSDIRDLGETIVKDATNKTNSQLISSVRSAIILYIFLRSFTKDHYNK